jgi:hypothetical protein
MTTIINTPPAPKESGGNIGMIIGVILLIIVAYLFIVYGLPAIRQMSSPQINIPNEIDVNINQSDE